jgi:multicomponent K+:H+ antiporter subunit D
VQAYLLGNWAAPWGIALALDRLSRADAAAHRAGGQCGADLRAGGGEDRQMGAHFHALFQFQLMGLNGAFLTADLFNLFVFFEVLLAASYGLLLHGATRARLKAAVHYVVFNLTGSALVPGRGEPAVCGGRHAEHGRPGAQAAAAAAENQRLAQAAR